MAASGVTSWGQPDHIRARARLKESRCKTGTVESSESPVPLSVGAGEVIRVAAPAPEEAMRPLTGTDSRAISKREWCRSNYPYCKSACSRSRSLWQLPCRLLSQAFVMTPWITVGMAILLFLVVAIGILSLLCLFGVPSGTRIVRH